MDVLGISGSLRKGSFNTLLLAAAARIAKEAGARFSTFDIGEVPHYNGDLDGDEPPEPVVALKDVIAGADALLIASPEYNYGMPGVLKNAIDWASRPAFESVLAGRPTAVISASMATTGGARAQIQLRTVLAGTLTPVYRAPDFALATAHQAFDDVGALKEERTLTLLADYVTGFLGWAGDQPE